MRQQGQQNRRGRSRGGRKIQNPLSRNYDSNGPDVKIRGTASHIAEKYTSLARDALSSGDTVAAENLFQHAEHYNRIIMAAQAPNASDVQPSVPAQANDASLSVVNETSSEGSGNDSEAQSQDGERKSDRQTRSRNAKNANPANGRRRRRRPNGNGAAKNGAEQPAEASQNEEKSAPVKKEAPEANETPPNGALL